MKRVHVVVEGIVQGVGYRWSTQHEAQRLGVSGWVRNRPDGSVEAELEGSPAHVDELLAWMAAGPRGAQVRASRVTDIPPRGDTRFDIHRDA